VKWLSLYLNIILYDVFIKMKADTSNSKIFHSIIQDLTDMIEKLRNENENMNQLIMDNEKLKHKLEQYESMKQNSLWLYGIISALSVGLFLY